MLSNEQKNILAALIDKYERSAGYFENITSKQRIALNFYNDGRNDFSYYQIENADSKAYYHLAVKELAKEGLICFSWMRGQEEHLIAKVWLNLDKLSQTYAILCRTPKTESMKHIIEILIEARSSTRAPWAVNFFEYCITYIKTKHSVPLFLSRDEKQVREICKIIVYVSKPIQNDVLERVFSLRILGDSKKFERLYRKNLLL